MLTVGKFMLSRLLDTDGYFERPIFHAQKAWDFFILTLSDIAA